MAAVILNYVGLYCEDSWGVGWGHIYVSGQFVCSLELVLVVGVLIIEDIYLPDNHHNVNISDHCNVLLAPIIYPNSERFSPTPTFAETFLRQGRR